MVSMAPEFGDIAGALSQRMQNRILVAHNIQFESPMLFNEFSRVKANFDPGVGICTLRHTKEKLPVACDSLGISKPTHHHALSDTRATAEILRVLRPEEETRSMSVSNLDLPNDNRTHRRNAARAENVLGRLISRMTYKGIADSHLAYIDLLDWVLDDLVITDEEREQMLLLSNELNMTPGQLREAHEQYFTSMVRGAEKDGVVTTDEHRCLGMVANALEVPIEWVPKPDDDNDPTAQVTAGSSVCFTGSFVDLNGNPISKSALKELAVSSGLEVFAICHQVKV